MFVSYNSTTKVIIWVDQREWACRKRAKKLTSPDYWAWLETVTTDGVPDFSGETEYTIVECTDENVQARLVELNDYIDRKPEGTTYNIKYYTSKRDGSHFVGDDTTKDKRILDEEWVEIRKERTRLLGETDHHALSDLSLIHI